MNQTLIMIVIGCYGEVGIQIQISYYLKEDDEIKIQIGQPDLIPNP